MLREPTEPDSVIGMAMAERGLAAPAGGSALTQLDVHAAGRRPVSGWN
ncbi:hypothetical protein ACWELO_20420 [Streptomyces sp. NPDC004596]